MNDLLEQWQKSEQRYKALKDAEPKQAEELITGTILFNASTLKTQF